MNTLDDRSSLTKEEKLRYEQQMWVRGIGLSGQKQLKAATVAVIGMGGLGCPAASYLAAAGIGQLRIIDADTVELGNLHRQLLFTAKDIGKPKVEVAKERLQALNPQMKIISIQQQLTTDNAATLLENCEAVLDCTDNLPSRYLINAWAVRNKKLLVSAGVVRIQGILFVYCGDRQTGIMDIQANTSGVNASGANNNDSSNNESSNNSGSDDKSTSSDPCYACLFPYNDQQVSNQQVNNQNCQELGVIGPVAGLMGAYQALELIQFLTRKVKETSKLVFINAQETEFRRVNLDQVSAWCPLHS